MNMMHNDFVSRHAPAEVCRPVLEEFYMAILFYK